MLRLFTYFQSHKGLLYTILVLTTVLFAFLAIQCRFEENIAKLLPPTDDNKTIDLAFTNLKVKDRICVQVVAKDSTDAVLLAQAMDKFMLTLTEEDEQQLVGNTLYQIDFEQLMPIAPWLIEHAPQYLDFTEAEMDSLTSTEHIQAQIRQYMEWLETDLGMQCYDYMTSDPAGILVSRLQPLLASSGQSRLYNGHLYSTDREVCIGYVTPNANSMDSGKAGNLLRLIEKAKADTEREFSDVEVLFHGTVIMSANNARRIKRDLLYTIGIALIVILLLLAWSFRQPSTNIIMLLPIIYGAVFALAGIWLWQGGMSVMALGIGAIVLGVALSYCLHVLVQYKYTGDAVATVRDQSLPVVLGALTTIGAFAGLLFTQSSLLRDFGLFSVLAMVGTTCACLIFMPHFFPRENKKNERAFHLMERLNGYDLSRNPWITGLTLLFVAVCIAFSQKVKFDSNLRNIGYVDPLVARSMQLFDEKQQDGLSSQYYASVATDLETALQGLQSIEQICDSLKPKRLINNYTRLSALQPSAQLQQERINHWQHYFTTDKQTAIWHNIEAACRLEGIESEIFAPFADAMQASYTPEYIAQAGLVPDALLANLIEYTDGNYLVFMPVKMPAENVTKVNDILSKQQGCLVLDPFYYTIDTVAMMQRDFNTILGISAIFVLIVLLLSFRRLTLALIAFLPMTLSWYTVLGAMYLTGHEFNLINIVVSSFIFGIGVDYSIFMMDGMLHSERGGDKRLLLYHKTAITLSATVLIICMLSLLFAKHPAIKSIGFASLVGMITTILLTYTLQPLLFRLVMAWRKKRENNK